MKGYLKLIIDFFVKLYLVLMKGTFYIRSTLQLLFVGQIKKGELLITKLRD